MVAARIRPYKRPAEGQAWSYRELGLLGVAATRFGDKASIWSHAALLYRWGKGKEVRIFEMQTHERLTDREASPGFVWIEPKLSEEHLQLVIARARLVFRVNAQGGLPYGFRYSRSAFDEKGVLFLGPSEVGLTCSTLIAAIFAAEQIRLLDPDTWPPADESDKADRRIFIAKLKEREHARRLAAEIDAPRIRPEEVVAATATFQEAVGTFDNLLDGAVVVAARTPLLTFVPSTAPTTRG